MPASELLLPGSARAYRNGIHEGVDFYSGDVGGCPAELSVTLATPILAAKQGVVIRTDWDYVELTQAELDAAAAAGFQGEEILDRFRGRQIWIDHGDDIVSRYAHLGAIAAGMQVGQTVAAGQIIGFAGESARRRASRRPAPTCTCTSRSASATATWARACRSPRRGRCTWRRSASWSRRAGADPRPDRGRESDTLSRAARDAPSTRRPIHRK